MKMTMYPEMVVIDSINELQRVLGHEIKYFAYPNGILIFDFGQREMIILVNNDFKLAFSTNAKNFTLKNKPLAIPRYGLLYGVVFLLIPNSS